MIYAYERDPYRTSFEAAVLAVGDEGGRPFAVLDDTIFFPEGGGQPADHGRFAGARFNVGVIDVARRDGEIRHYLDAPAVPGPVALELDWQRRYDLMQQHTAQHLLTAVALHRFGWPTTAFHLRREVSDIELGVSALRAEDLRALEEAVVAQIRADRPVTARRVTREEYAGLEVRSRGLPAGHRGEIRLVEIAGIDRNTCGGTHVASTAELETVKLLSTEPMRGGTRLHWVAGSRVRRRLERHEARAAKLRRLFDTADENLASIAALKLAQLKDAERRGRALEARLAESVADALPLDSHVAEAHFEATGAAFLQQVARRFLARHPGGAALLTAAGPDGAFFAVALGGEVKADLQAIGRRVAERLEGRGGGSRGLFQGKAGSLARRAEALAGLRGELEAGKP